MGYFFAFTCQDKTTIINNGGKVIENDNGSVSLFINDGDGVFTPVPMTKSCCQKLDPNYTFNCDTQKCVWSQNAENCEIQPFKVVLNPNGNEGVIFNVEENTNEDCTLDVSFDYLMQFDCEDVMIKLQEAISQTGGLTAQEIQEVQTLQNEYDNCISQRDKYETMLFELQTELESTPYVIECVNNNPPPTGVDSTKYVQQTKTTQFGELGVNFGLPPKAFPLTSDDTTRYCLTDAGLLEWSTILGTNTYNAWVNSNGMDVSLYDCDEVNQLVALDNNTGDLLGTCDVSVSARRIVKATILKTQSSLDGLSCDEILTRLELLQPNIPCSTVTDIFETLDVCMTVDMVNPITYKLETVYEETILNIGAGNLPTYLNDNQPNTGLLSTGTTGTTSCQNVNRQLMGELQEVLPNSGSTQIQNLVQNSFNSEWLKFETSITNQNIINMISNEKIKISLFIKSCCVDFAILIDRVNLDKNCATIDNTSTTISTSPSFDMIRVCDNKKSWLSNEDFKHREFDLRFRDTQYDINNYKLAINSKEVDLDINPSHAIEQDLFCYVKDNPCILTASTETTGTTETIITCGCPYGFTDNGSNCVYSATTAATFNGSGSTIVAGDTIPSYGEHGTFFYPSIQDNGALPVTRVGVSTIVTDQTGGTITRLTQSLSGNTFWGSVGSASQGRLNNVGISASTTEYLGFSECIELVSGGTYYVALAADNTCKFSVDGIEVVIFSGFSSYNFKVWHVFPFEFSSGKHLIEMQGKNSTAETAFGAEIYNPIDFETLTGATTTGDTGLIFSTADKIGGEFDLGTSIGYTCPTGYSLDLCDIPVSCTKLRYEDVICSTAFTTTICGDNGVDLDKLLTTEMSAITSLKEFKDIVSSELINVRGWKTMSSHPTLRLLYDRYMNSTDYCDTLSSQFDYCEMIEFSELVGTYWVDLIEQVVPATTIWGSTYVYGNTIFDQQKFQYKKYSLFGCQLPNYGGDVVSPVTGWTTDVQVEFESLPNDEYYNQLSGSITGETFLQIHNEEPTDGCIGGGIVQMNCGSEFIGKIINYLTPVNNGTVMVISECAITVDIYRKGESASAIIGGDVTGPVSFLWSNGETTQDIVGVNINDPLSVTVTDNGVQGCTATADSSNALG